MTAVVHAVAAPDTTAAPPVIRRDCGCGDSCADCAEKEPLGGSAGVRLGPRDDPFEREADRMADAVMAADPLQRQPVEEVEEKLQASCDSVQRQEEEEEEETLQAKTDSTGAGGRSAVPAAAAAVSSGGRPLPVAARSFFEPRFGRDLSHVRIHTDAEAGGAAQGIGARAYTLRNHIAFAPGQFDPTSSSGRHLMAHELTHTFQQGRTGALRRVPVTQRDTTPAPTGGTAGSLVPPTQSFEEMLQEFTSVEASDPDRAAELVNHMAAAGDLQDLRRHGIDLIFWALDHGYTRVASAVAERMSSVYTVTWAVGELTRRGPLGIASPDPAVILQRAKDEARAGRHGPAAELFALAYELAQLILIDLTQFRRSEIGEMEAQIGGSAEEQVAVAQARTFGILSPTIQQYPDMSRLIGIIREVFGFYPRGELAAQRAGDSDTARQYSGLGLVLRMDLIENHTLDASVITMESVAAFNRFGTRGYQTVGTTGEDEVVTPLPGTATTEELGLFPTFNTSLENLAESVAGQEEFLAEIQNVPEVRRAFPRRAPDMNSQADRLRVWEAMYRSFQRTDELGMGVLYQLMSLIGRYLNAFTRHTEYNIRDFGVSYLSSDLPTDLAGRAVRDCGVYALTVAYEVSRTARAARPPLSLEFRLFSVPEHVTLVIFDLDQEQHYVVNNDRITPPRPGGPNDPEVLQNVANAFAQTFSSQYVLRPMQDITLGTTRQSDTSFRREAWQNYLISTLWGLETEAPSGPNDTRSEAERAQATYERYYEAFRNFDRGARNLQAALDGLSAQLAGMAPADQRTHLEQAISQLFPLSVNLAIIFSDYGPNARTVAQGDPERVRAVMGSSATPGQVQSALGNRAYFFAHQPGRHTDAHPVSRMAIALMHLRDLGGTLDDPQTSFIDWVRRVPGLNRYVQEWEQAGRPARF